MKLNMIPEIVHHPSPKIDKEGPGMATERKPVAGERKGIFRLNLNRKAQCFYKIRYFYLLFPSAGFKRPKNIFIKEMVLAILFIKVDHLLFLQTNLIKFINLSQ